MLQKSVNSQKESVGIYLHIPFCKQKCNYCDFCSSPSFIDKADEYTDALLKEIDTYKSADKIYVDSVFFGGGTPSILPSEQFIKIVEKLNEIFFIGNDAEITLEANPKTLTAEKLEVYKKCGVNRLSIGMQTIHENELKKLGRIHNFEDFLTSFRIARNAGFDNINIDLMYGIPEQTVESFKKTLETVISLSPEHISCYGLIIEENTPFYELKGTLNLPKENDELDMYDACVNELSIAGYRHYEISNYSKEGYICRHNMKYWTLDEYIGFGISAHSFYNGRRYYNKSDFGEYISSNCLNYRQNETDFIGIDYNEYIMLRLRISDGIVFREFKDIFGFDFRAGREELLKRYVEAGYAVYSDNSFFLTDKGFYLSNAIISTLI